MTPYRQSASAIDCAAEAREVEEFARKMHAGRRVWANEHLGMAVTAALNGAAVVALSSMNVWTGRPLDVAGPLILGPLGVLLLVLAVHRLRAWRRATRR